MHIMVDTETWGITPGSMIRSIGAVVFNPLNGLMGPTFYANIDDASQEAIGLHKDDDTITFWEDRPQAEQALLVDQRPVKEVLTEFVEFWKAKQGVNFWSHGANFDEVLLACAMRAADIAVPWKFWDVRCCRTVLALGNRRAFAGEAAHNALTDAKAQAVVVAAALKGRLPIAGWR